MDLFKRLFTRKLKKNKQSEKNPGKSTIHTSQSTNDLLTAYPVQDQQAVVNRLLRSSSARFSILSETEYRSLPPILYACTESAHPINTLLREPSIISTQTANSVNTYTVTIHTRTVHSRTEFPNANGTTSLLSTPASSPQRTSHPLPPLTPGDKTRLEKLRQDPSVLSLLDIFDETGHPNPKAFGNTPTRQRKVSTFKMLLGEHEIVEENSREDVKESDFSWAEHVLERAQKGSSSASSLHSSLGIAEDLFKNHLSDIGDVDDLTGSMTSQSSEIADSLEVGLGTAEDGSLLIHPLKSVRSEESLLRFLSKEGKQSGVGHEVPPLQATSSKLSTVLQVVPQAPRGPRGMGEPEPKPLPRLTVRNGPQQQQTQLSPPPTSRKQQPPPLPPIPHDFQFNSSRPGKVNPLGFRAPFTNNIMGGSVIPSGTTDRLVSVASSIYPQIETMQPPPLPSLPDLPKSIPQLYYDSFTPIPRRPLEGRRETKTVPVSIDENIPPGAPLRPTKSQVRKFLKAPLDRNKQNDQLRVSPKKIQEIDSQVDNSNGDDGVIDARTPKKPLMARFQTPERPSPSLSSELSPKERRIMATVRVHAHSPGRTPRKWNPLVDNMNTLTTATAFS
ncbi:hypothetical protein Clacol_005639 [Clathrus columnatus]|uniref:Uncharacterized protein n=1 Tax=Clathrus columnatus TaxID=1419009 RepID=A0AAV5AFZ5_9AGAM|nr:hypothetical protein Clacol_005639 [Clathrus columnatus]